MRRLIVSLAFLGWSCDRDPEVLVGRLAEQDGGVVPDEVETEDFSCTDPRRAGPGGYTYCPFAEPTANSQLLSAPTADGVSFLAQSPIGVRAGVAFQFSSAGTALDLSSFSSIALTMAISQGEGFELFLGRGTDLGCSYVFSKSASNVYSVALRQAAWCVPSQCGFDLRSTGGLLLADVPSVSTLEATLTDVAFEATGIAAGSASAMSAGIGPGGLCWFLVGWNYGTASWVPGQVSSSSAYVRSHASGNAVAGMAFEVPDSVTLSQYSSIQLTADVTVATDSGTFLVQGVSEERGIIWRFAPVSGVATYSLVLGQFESTFGQPALTLDEIERFEIVTPTGGTSDFEANVTSVAFVK